MPALREVFARFGVEFDDRKLRQGDRAVTDAKRSVEGLDKRVTDATGSIRAFAGLVGGAAVIGGLARLTQSVVTSTRELGLWSERLQISTEDMLGWQHAAARVGASTDDVTDALKELQLKAQDAISGGESQAEMFQRVGLSIDDLRPLVNDATGLMDLFTTALNDNVEAGLQNFTVDELMSDAGTRLLPLFRQGTRAIREYRREAARTAGRDMPALVRATQRITETQADLNLRWTAAKNRLAVALAPAIETASKKLGELLGILERATPAIADLLANSSALQAALVTAGVAVAVAWGPAAIAALATLAPFVALFLVAEDIITAMRGGDSAIERFFAAFEGAEAAEERMAILRETVKDLSRWIGYLEGRIRGFLGFEDVSADIADPREREEARRGYERGRAQPAALRALGRLYTGGVRGLLREEARDPVERGAGQRHLQRLRQQERAELRAQRDFERGILGPSPVEQQISIDSPMTMTVTVNEAGDPEQTREVVREEMREAQTRQLREVRRTLGGTG